MTCDALGLDDELAGELGFRERHRGKARGAALLAPLPPASHPVARTRRSLRLRRAVTP